MCALLLQQPALIATQKPQPVAKIIIQKPCKLFLNTTVQFPSSGTYFGP